MASIEPRGDSWRIVWRIGGRGGPKQYVTTSSDKRAETVKSFVEDRGHRVTDDEVYRSLFPGAGREVDAPLLRDWVGTWVDAKAKSGDVQPDTLDTYRQLLRNWAVPRLGDYPLDTINADAITDWVSWMGTRETRSGRRASADTIRKAHAVLHQALGAAVPRFLPANPAAKPAGSRRDASGLPAHVAYEAVFLEPTEADIVLAACSPHIRDLVEIALLTGLRLGELLVLRREDVDLSSKEPAVFVRRALKADGSIGGPKSQRSRRTVTLSKRAAVVFGDCIEGKGRSALVFTTPTGLMWSKDNIRERYWKVAVAAAQRCPDHMPPAPPRSGRGRQRVYRNDEVSTCDCATRLHKVPRFHDLRHTAISWLIAAGWDMFVISRRAGHQSIKTTMDIYGHLMRQGGSDGLSALDALAGV
jgi:integrase